MLSHYKPLFGPFFIACTLFLMNLRPGFLLWTIPSVALLGCLLSIFWRWSGLIVSLVLLVGSFSFGVYTEAFEINLWSIGILLSLGVSLGVTVLSLEEAQEVLDEDQELISKNQAALNHLHKTHQESIAFYEKQLQETKELVSLVKEELENSSHRQRKLMQDLVTSRLVNAENLVSVGVLSKSQVAEYDKQLSTQANQLKTFEAEIQKFTQLLVDFRAQEEKLNLENEANQLKINVLQNQKEELKEICVQLEEQKQTWQEDLQKITAKLDDQVSQSLLLQAQNDDLKQLSVDFEEKECLRRDEKLAEEAKISHLNNQLILLNHQYDRLNQVCTYFEEKEKLSLHQKQQDDFKIKEMEDKLASLQERHDLIAGDSIELVEMKLQHEDLNQELVSLKKVHDELNNELENVQISNQNYLSKLQKKDELLIDLSVEFGEKRKGYEKLKVEHQELKQNYEALKVQIEVMQISHENRLIELQKTQEINSSSPVDEEVDHEVSSQEIARLSGLYNQLREQFVEKSSLLDSTRKELFHSEEKSEGLKRLFEEEVLALDLKHQAQVVELLASVDEELALIEEKDREITQLNAVIDQLSNAHLVSI